MIAVHNKNTLHDTQQGNDGDEWLTHLAPLRLLNGLLYSALGSLVAAQVGPWSTRCALRPSAQVYPLHLGSTVRRSTHCGNQRLMRTVPSSSRKSKRSSRRPWQRCKGLPSIKEHWDNMHHASNMGRARQCRFFLCCQLQLEIASWIRTQRIQ